MGQLTDLVTEWVNRDVCGPGPLFQCCRLRGLLLLPLLLLRGPRGRHRPPRVEAAVGELLLVGRLQQRTVGWLRMIIIQGLN